jgi:hypothetical protein
MDYTLIVHKAYEGLFEQTLERKVIVKYYRSFKGYNATVRYTKDYLEFHLSHKWKDVGDDIKLGLIQHLLVKVFLPKEKRDFAKTLNMELYEIFLKKVHLSIPKDNIDAVLLESFQRVNQEYFNGIIEDCNLVWGQKSSRKFGSYDYSTDTIKMSSIFRSFLPEKNYLVDYVMYHEMLHKKLKYDHTKKGKRYHTTEFRYQERKFKNSAECEKELTMIASKKKIKNVILDFFRL